MEYNARPVLLKYPDQYNMVTIKISMFALFTSYSFPWY